ncbi:MULTISPECIES: hypothetical protein [unclassified Embleya]|uniref:hypothetical protein n=1 Tax=unclassified Embleya TaxID=2699296 RepID=UPI0033E8275D
MESVDVDAVRADAEEEEFGSGGADALVGDCFHDVDPQGDVQSECGGDVGSGAEVAAGVMGDGLVLNGVVGVPPGGEADAFVGEQGPLAAVDVDEVGDDLDVQAGADRVAQDFAEGGMGGGLATGEAH